MPHTNRNRRNPAIKGAAAMLVVLITGLLLAACGGSSKSSSGASSGTSTKAAGGGRGQVGARGNALRTCLQKNGIALPQRKPSQGRPEGKGGPFGASGAGGGLQLPKGVTRAQLKAAFKKCGAGTLVRSGQDVAGAGGAQRFAKFSACMRKNGVNLPAPNTSGKGPIFNTKGIDTSSGAFKAAQAKCMQELIPSGARTGGPGGAPGGAPGTATPDGAAPQGPSASG